MAVALGTAFVRGTSLPANISPFVGPRNCNRSHLRIVSESVSTTMRGSEDGVSKQGGEVSSLVANGIEKPRELWWAPLFQVSAEDQWSTLLADSADVKATKKTQTLPPLAPVSTTATPLPGVIDKSTRNERKLRSSQASFTPEKARTLRKRLRDSETWHDEWYHSAIASRLAEAID